MGEKSFKFKLKTEYIILLFFALATVLYVNIDKVPLTHPGNLKAADAFYHSLMVEGILDSNQWNYFDYSISMGQEKAVNVQPPLYYINAAILTLFSKVPAWATFYLLICISQAFFVIIVYLISKEVFENNTNIQLLAAAFAVLPLTLKAWLYAMYIGIWLQIIGYFFVLCYLWLFIRYLKKKENWTLIFMGISISSVLLTHPMDLIFLFIPSVIVGINIILPKIKKKKIDFKAIINQSLMFGLIPLISIISMLPRILFQWASQGGGQYNFGYYGFRELWFSRNYLGGLPFPDIFFIPTIILILFGIGMFQLFLNKKKYVHWLYPSIFYFAVIYLGTIFTLGPDYYGRARSMTPFFIYPTVAYAIYHFLIRQLKKNQQLITTLVLSIIIILIAIPSYIEITKQMTSEHVSLSEWNSYLWIQQNTPKDAKILFYGTAFQSEYIYSKRITAVFNINEFQKAINEFSQTNITPLYFKGGWGANTLRATRRYEISMFEYANYPEPSSNLSILDFDYVVFQNLNQQISQINSLMISRYIQEYEFIPVYDKEGYIIIKNEKKQ